MGGWGGTAPTGPLVPPVIMPAQNTWIGSQTTMVANMATTASNTIPTEEQLFIFSVVLILRSPPARTQTECG